VLTHIVRRILIAIPLLLAMSFVTFLFMTVVYKGDPLAQYKLDPTTSKETIDNLRKKYHLNKPPAVRYFLWLGGVLRGDLGYSIHQKQKVSVIIRSRIWPTLLLSLSAMICAWVLAIPLGIYCAVHQGKLRDRLLSLFAFLGMAIPSFFFALLLLWAISVTGILPLGGYQSTDFEKLSFLGKVLDIGAHLILPTVVLGFGAMGGLQRIMRGNMLEALRSQYVTTARAKGLSETRVVYWHALRTAINPMITIFGYQLSGLLSGAALMEIVINWPGLGNLMLGAVRAQDHSLVMGSMLISGVLLILGNLVADILLSLSDPRISYS